MVASMTKHAMITSLPEGEALPKNQDGQTSRHQASRAKNPATATDMDGPQPSTDKSARSGALAKGKVTSGKGSAPTTKTGNSTGSQGSTNARFTGPDKGTKADTAKASKRTPAGVTAKTKMAK